MAKRGNEYQVLSHGSDQGDQESGVKEQPSVAESLLMSFKPLDNTDRENDDQKHDCHAIPDDGKTAPVAIDRHQDLLEFRTQDLPKRHRTRGTRGKGDPRNDKMKRDKERAKAQREQIGREEEAVATEQNARSLSALGVNSVSKDDQVEASSLSHFGARSNTPTMMINNKDPKSGVLGLDVETICYQGQGLQTVCPPKSRIVVKLPVSSNSPINEGKDEPSTSRLESNSQAVQLPLTENNAEVRAETMNVRSKETVEGDMSLEDRHQTSPPGKAIVNMPTIRYPDGVDGFQKIKEKELEHGNHKGKNHSKWRGNGRQNFAATQLGKTRTRIQEGAMISSEPRKGVRFDLPSRPNDSPTTTRVTDNRRIHSMNSKETPGPISSPVKRHLSSLSSLNTTSVSPSKMSTYVKPAWAQNESLTVKLHGLPPNVKTGHVWNNLKKLGVDKTLRYIEIFQNKNGVVGARVEFKPPPSKPFWDKQLEFTMEDWRPDLSNEPLAPPSQVIAHLDKDRLSLKPSTLTREDMKLDDMELHIDQLDFGVLYTPKSMTVMRILGLGNDERVWLKISPLKRYIDIQFRGLPVYENNPKKGTKVHAIRHYRIQIRFSQLTRVIQLNDEGRPCLIFSLENPPEVYKRLFDVSKSHTVDGKKWQEWDTWFRHTDINENLTDYRYLPANLKQSIAVINIGRWTTYRVILSNSQDNPLNLNSFQRILREHNIAIASDPGFGIFHERQTAVWKWIDRPQQTQLTTSNLQELLNHDHVGLPHEVRYLLEVCISQGKLNEYNLGKDFIDRLLMMEDRRAIDLLDHVANRKSRCFEPMTIFKAIVTKGPSSRTKIPSYCCMIKAARMTPTTIYYTPATMEVSNRIIRRYKEYADRFLRVKFTDEIHVGGIYAARNNNNNQLYTRVWHALLNGIVIGDRKYEFLAYGNSQIREQSCYFFAPLDHLNASHIRAWMGEFHQIDVIAKYAARLGQCFSTTWAVACPKVSFKTIEDVERVHEGKKHVFTDGVGKISQFIARLATSELRGLRHMAEPPSVYQFRLGGCKGILAVAPELGNNEIHIRPSQDKFPANSKGLEIIAWSQYAPAHLNRQLILVLSALGVQDEVFMKKLLENLTSLDLAIKDSTVACRELQRIVDPNHETISIAELVMSGFHDSREPFVTSLLQLWRAWRVKKLKEKADISIPGSALLYGCVDETATLKGHFDSLQVGPQPTEQEKLDSLPEIFVQVSSQGESGTYDIIEGVCLLARNPSLHAGDIRVVRAVNNPKLYHLKDVVVLPQTGDRSLAGMCSGGDLDGDDFLVIWDPDMSPREWNHTPMDYTAPEPLRAEGQVTIQNVMAFFVNYMKNNRLPIIAHAHLAWADRLDEGVMSEKCTELAALHSKAVDYNKTGVPAMMSPDQHPTLWPHFMEKKNQPAHKIYHSKKVLGQIYDHVQRVDFLPNYSGPFDERILHACNPPASLLDWARELKLEYDQEIQQIMAQFDVKTEFEIWTTFLLDYKWGPSDYKMHEITGRLASSLKDRFRQACHDHVGGKDFGKVAPLAVAMYKITCEEMQAALRECRQAKQVGGELVPIREMKAESMPFMSFPWVLQKELCKIRAGDFDRMQVKPVAQYDAFSVVDTSMIHIAEDHAPISVLSVDKEPASTDDAQAKFLEGQSPMLAGIGSAFKDSIISPAPAGNERFCSPARSVAGLRIPSSSQEDDLVQVERNSNGDEIGRPPLQDPFISVLQAQTNDPKYGDFARRLVNSNFHFSAKAVKSRDGSKALSQRDSSPTTEFVSLIDASNRNRGISWEDSGRDSQLPSGSASPGGRENQKVEVGRLNDKIGGLLDNDGMSKLGAPHAAIHPSDRFNTGIWAKYEDPLEEKANGEDSDDEEIVFDDDGALNPLDILAKMHEDDH